MATAPAIVTGGRGGTRATDGTNPWTQQINYDVSTDLLRFLPEATPLITYVKSKVARVVATETPEWYWYEEDNYTYRYITVTGATYAALSTVSAVSVGAVGALYTNALLKVPRTGEVLRVKSKAALILTVERMVGSSIGTIVAGDVLVLMGNANAEGASLLTIIQTLKIRRTGYTQIVRTPYALTETAKSTRTYLGDPMEDERVKAAINHKLDWEKIAIMGQLAIDTTGTNPKRYTSGLLENITTNVTPVGGALTEDVWETFLRTGMRWCSNGKKHKLFLCSATVAQYLNSFAREKITIVNDASTYGISISRMVCAAGTVDVVVHDLLEYDYAGYGILIDVALIKYRPLNGNGKSRDTKAFPDRQANDVDGETGEYITEAGFEIRGDRFHSLMTGVV